MSSCVVNNGYFTKDIPLSRGIFQGCPISPLLFILAIETLAISIRTNSHIKGIPIEDCEKKLCMYADDTIVFLDGRVESFQNLFDTLGKFAEFSGCKINVSKSEAIHIGSLKGSELNPFSAQGLQ